MVKDQPTSIGTELEGVDDRTAGTRSLSESLLDDSLLPIERPDEPPHSQDPGDKIDSDVVGSASLTKPVPSVPVPEPNPNPNLTAPIPDDAGRSTTSLPSVFDSTSTSFTSPPFGTQFNFADFQFDSNAPQTFDIQAQSDIQVPSDSWFESLLSVLPLDNANPGLEGHQPQFLGVPQNLGAPMSAGAATQGMFPFPETSTFLSSPPLPAPPNLLSSLVPVPLGNTEAEELRLLDPRFPLPPGAFPINSTSAPSPTPPAMTTVPPTVSPLSCATSLTAQDLPPLPSKSADLPPSSPLKSCDGKENKAVMEEEGGGKSTSGNAARKKGPPRKRKAAEALGAKEGGTKPKKKRAKPVEKTTDMPEPNGAKETDRVTKEAAAKAAQEAAVAAAKAAKEAAKAAAQAAKEAKEAAKGAPELATRSGRSSNLPDHLKQVGYAPPKRGSRAKKDA